MRLTILGSGTALPSSARSSAGLWVDAGAARVRLDCGAGTLHALARFGLPWRTMTHQVVTHFHLDHVGELPALLFAFRADRTSEGAGRTEPLSLVGPTGFSELLRGVAQAFRSRILEQRFPLDLVEVAPGEVLTLAPGVILRAAKTPHTDESLALRLEADGRSLGYTGDTAPSPALADFFADVDLLVGECSFWDAPRESRHLGADDLADLAQAARARRLIATHCYFTPEDVDLTGRLRARYDGEVLIATDGLTVEL